MKKILKVLVRIYQTVLSPLLGPRCRFYPSCSHYYLESLDKHTIARAHIQTIKRLAKCGPWHPGGIDLP
jgi:putative membrane protein insertion efficiency factor